MKLLFFSARCDLTGAEVALHRLIHNANRTETKMAVACGAHGQLSKTLPNDVPVFRYSHALSFARLAFGDGHPAVWFANNVFNGMIRLIHARVKPDFWYINTTTQPKLVALARDMRVPCILHTHEFGYMSPLLKSRDIETMISYPSLIIASSNCAAEAIRVLGRRENIEVCYGPIDVAHIKADTERSRRIRQTLRIPNDAFVWAMSGSRDANKNPVGFVRIANKALKDEPNAFFLWIGGNDTADSVYAKALAKTLQIDHRILWLPPRDEEYFHYLDVADGFVLTSLNESFSLVTLEAAALGKPFVSFNSGGPEEFFKEGMGIVVNSWNIDDIVRAMLQIMRGDIYVNADISRKRAREFDVSIIVKQWQRILRKYIGA